MLVFAYSPVDAMTVNVLAQRVENITLYCGVLPDDWDGSVVVFDYFNHLGDEYDIAKHMEIEREKIKRVLQIACNGVVNRGGQGGEFTKIHIQNWIFFDGFKDVLDRFKSGENLGLKLS
jgi:hypothetical protein